MLRLNTKDFLFIPRNYGIGAVSYTHLFVANQVQNPAVQSAIHHAFSTIPGVLWLLTAAVLFFYQINKNSYNRIIAELGAKKG